MTGPGEAFSIGSVGVDPALISAPMVGVSHSPFRQLVASFAAPGLFFSEMLSARHLPQAVAGSSFWLRRTEEERPMAWQIFAATPEDAGLGCQQLMDYGAEIVDLNLACPAPNIARKRAGAFLLQDLPAVAEILAAMKRVAHCPLTVKIRLGTRPDLLFLADLAAVFDEAGVDAITLHPRLIDEKLKRRARWEYIGHLKNMTRIPVIGNGDVLSRQDCLKMFAQTSCDGVMIGRALVQKPWLFQEILQGEDLAVTAPFLYETWCRAVDMIRGGFPDRRALGRIKEFTWYFSRNLRFGNRFAARLQAKQSIDACCEFAAENFIRAY